MKIKLEELSNIWLERQKAPFIKDVFRRLTYNNRFDISGRQDLVALLKKDDTIFETSGKILSVGKRLELLHYLIPIPVGFKYKISFYGSDEQFVYYALGIKDSIKTKKIFKKGNDINFEFKYNKHTGEFMIEEGKYSLADKLSNIDITKEQSLPHCTSSNQVYFSQERLN